MTLGTIFLWATIFAVSVGALFGFCALTVFVISAAVDAWRNPAGPQFVAVEPEDDSFTLAELHSLPDWEV